MMSRLINSHARKRVGVYRLVLDTLFYFFFLCVWGSVCVHEAANRVVASTAVEIAVADRPTDAIDLPSGLSQAMRL